MAKQKLVISIEGEDRLSPVLTKTQQKLDEFANHYIVGKGGVNDKFIDFVRSHSGTDRQIGEVVRREEEIQKRKRHVRLKTEQVVRKAREKEELATEKAIQ